jgi:adenosylcobinamide kinase / adenosylcobinamide-phosphate guanylyltransferase
MAEPSVAHPTSIRRATINLVTGPARSGKSEWAEKLAAATAQEVVYLATATRCASDREWQQRIEQHIQRRPAHWQTQEVSIELATAITHLTHPQCALVDSLGTWLANLIELDDPTWQTTQDQLLQTIQQTTADLIFVSEETGWGVVPAYPIGRTFRDRLGYLTRRVAAIADHTYLATAGHVLDLSQLGQPISTTAIRPHQHIHDQPQPIDQH